MNIITQYCYEKEKYKKCLDNLNHEKDKIMKQIKSVSKQNNFGRNSDEIVLLSDLSIVLTQINKLEYELFLENLIELYL